MLFNKTTLHWKFIIIEIESNQVFSVFTQFYAVVGANQHTSTLQSVDRCSLLKTNRMSISLTCQSTKKYCTRHVDTTSRLIVWRIVGSVDAPLHTFVRLSNRPFFIQSYVQLTLLKILQFHKNMSVHSDFFREWSGWLNYRMIWFVRVYSTATCGKKSLTFF